MRAHKLVLWGLLIAGVWMVEANTAQAQIIVAGYGGYYGGGYAAPVYQASYSYPSYGYANYGYAYPSYSYPVVQTSYYGPSYAYSGYGYGGGYSTPGYYRSHWNYGLFGHVNHHSHYRGCGFRGHHHYRW